MKKIFSSILLLIIVLSGCVNKDAQNIEKHKRDSIRAERIRIDSINNIGIWEISAYMDEFREKTDKKYVRCQVFGTFSNSATTDSKLRVVLAIDTSNIQINLFEYADNHPIKGEGTVYFKIRDSRGEVHEIRAYNNDKGATFVDEKYIQDIFNLLKLGGQIKFVATTDKYGSPSVYNFTIDDAESFEKALSKIK